MLKNNEIINLRAMRCPCEFTGVASNSINPVLEFKNQQGFTFLKNPLLAIIEITNKCNLRCKHCCIIEKRNENGIHISIFQQLINVGIKNFELTGGEPLLHPQFNEIIKILAYNECYFRVVSNGTLWDDDLIELIKEYTNVEILISLDGCQRTHDYIRGIGTYNKALKTIQKLKKVNVKTGVSSAISKINLEEIDYLFKVIREENLDYFQIIPLRINTLDKCFGKKNVLSRENHEFIDRRIQVNELNCSIIFNNPYIIKESYEAVFFGCKMGSIACSIDSNAALQKCPVSRHTVGLITENNFLDLWDNLQITIRNELYNQSCQECIHRPLCAGICRFK